MAKKAEWFMEGSRKVYKSLKDLLADAYNSNSRLREYRGGCTVYKNWCGYAYLHKGNDGFIYLEKKEGEYNRVLMDGTIASPSKLPQDKGKTAYVVEVVTDAGASPVKMTGSLKYIRKVALARAKSRSFAMVNIFKTDGEQIGRVSFDYPMLGGNYYNYKNHSYYLLNDDGSIKSTGIR